MTTSSATKYSLIPSLLLIFIIHQTCSYRLSEVYQPISYEVSLKFPKTALTTLEDNAFGGTVKITMNLTADIDEMAFHMSHERLEIESLTIDGTIRKYQINNETDVVSVSCLQGFTASVTHIVEVQYRGMLGTTDLLGVYKSSYVDSLGETRYIATTMAAPLSARMIFPCLDEPTFKATFKIDITVPSGFNAIANAAVRETQKISEDQVIYYFETTPVMSSYLVAFVVSEFSCTRTLAHNVTLQTCSRKESITSRDLSVEYAPKILGILNEYTNVQYSSEMSKLDLAAVGDFAFEAMENWGLPIMSESTLLWDEHHSSLKQKLFVTRKITHDASHQWFGNLVTLKWWSDTYINEAFAAYFEYYLLDKLHPEWQLRKQYNVELLQAALQGDVSSVAPPLSSAVETTEEILQKIGQSYSKGGSIFGMLMNIIGEDEMKAGLQNYLLLYKYKNVASKELWAALEPAMNATKSKLPAALGDVMQNWIEKPGFPIVTATLKNGVVSLTQERYLLTGTNDTQWYIPISYTLSTDGEKFSNTLPMRWLVPNGNLDITLPTAADWIIFNNQQSGYYRVNYDQTLWTRIQTALASANFGGIHELNRAQIVDDIFNLARIKKTSYQNVFKVIDFLRHDTSYYTWTAALNGFGFLLDRVGSQTTLGKAMTKYMLNSMESVLATVPLAASHETDTIYTLKQGLVQKWACKLRQKECLDTVKEQFHAFKYLGIRPNKNIITIIFSTALSQSTIQSDWELVWTEYVKSNVASEKTDLLTALGSTSQQTILEKLLALTISDDKSIRPQDRNKLFSAIVESSSTGYSIAFKFLQEKYNEIAVHYQDMNSLVGAINAIAKKIRSKNDLNKLTDLIKNKISEKYRAAAQASLEEVQANLKWDQQQTSKLYNINQLNICILKKLIALITHVLL